MSPESTPPDPSRGKDSPVSRRTILGAAAWSVPAISLMVASPAVAASTPALGQLLFDAHSGTLFNDSSMTLTGVIVPDAEQPLPAVLIVTLEGSKATAPLTITASGSTFAIPLTAVAGSFGTVTITVSAPGFLETTTSVDVIERSAYGDWTPVPAVDTAALVVGSRQRTQTWGDANNKPTKTDTFRITRERDAIGRYVLSLAGMTTHPITDVTITSVAGPGWRLQAGHPFAWSGRGITGQPFTFRATASPAGYIGPAGGLLPLELAAWDNSVTLSVTYAFPTIPGEIYTVKYLV